MNRDFRIPPSEAEAARQKRQAASAAVQRRRHEKARAQELIARRVAGFRTEAQNQGHSLPGSFGGGGARESLERKGHSLVLDYAPTDGAVAVVALDGTPDKLEWNSNLDAFTVGGAPVDPLEWIDGHLRTFRRLVF